MIKMLQITIPDQEFWDEAKEEFLYVKSRTLCLEHSLVSISKWESKWKKPFIRREPMTIEESIDYIKCMTITQNVPDDYYNYIPQEVVNKVNAYIEDDMTATTFNEEKGKGNREVITSELIYYWMVAYQIPFECQKWHLNRLLTLIRICSIKNSPEKKMGRNELRAQNRALNAARRSRMGSRG